MVLTYTEMCAIHALGNTGLNLGLLAAFECCNETPCNLSCADDCSSLSPIRWCSMQRLQYLVARPYLLEGDNTSEQCLEIITGSSKHSAKVAGGISMKTIVRSQLAKLQLACVKGSNPGRLQIPHPALYQYVQQEKHSMTRSTFLHEASIRYLIVFGGISGVLSAMYVVPKLLTEF